MSTRASRTSTPGVNIPGTPSSVHIRERPYRGATPAAVDTLGDNVEQQPSEKPWWAPVARWEKQWVVPKGAKIGGSGTAATLGPRPGDLPKPMPYEIKIMKYVKVPSKRPRSFDDEDEDPSQAASVMDNDADPRQIITDAEKEQNQDDQNDGDIDAEAEGEADVDADADVPTVEDLQEQEDPDNVDEMEQLESTQLIVEEDIEMLGPGTASMTAMPQDVDETLSHPLQMGMPHDHTHRSHPAPSGANVLTHGLGSQPTDANVDTAIKNAATALTESKEEAAEIQDARQADTGADDGDQDGLDSGGDAAATMADTSQS